MPASKHGEVQTDNHDGRKFITLKVGSNREPAYRKVYLRTKDARVARRRAKVLDDIADLDEARRRIDYLDSSISDDQERRRIAELTGQAPLVPEYDPVDALRDLERLTKHDPEAEITEDLVERWCNTTDPSEWRQILVDAGLNETELNENPAIFETISVKRQKLNLEFRPKNGALGAVLGITTHSLPEDKPARGPRLSACVEEFRKEQQQRQNTAKHINECIRKFNLFVKFLADKRIGALCKSDFVRYADHVLATTAKKSAKTAGEHLQKVEMVLDTARTRMDDNLFPEGLDNWLGVLRRSKRNRPYKSPLQNRQPMPPTVFAALLDKAEEWATMDIKAYAEILPVNDGDDKRKRPLLLRNNLRYARNTQRTGAMGHSMLCLAANAGAQPVDFARLQWSELILDGDLPVYREDRAKPSHLLGSEVPRCCPLLPTTITSLKRWKEFRDAELATANVEARKHAAYVFTTSDLLPFRPEDSSGVTKILTRIRKQIQAGFWQFRHLRNIGSTLRRDSHLPESMADAWLGHSARGTNKFYTGEAKDDYLLPLVTVIGESYFKQAAASDRS